MKKITSLSNPLIKHFFSLRKDRRYREEKKALFIAGNKIVSELIEKKVPIKTLLTTEKFSKKIATSIEHIVITDEIMKKITGLVSPEELAAEVIMPEKRSITSEKYLLVLDQIQDPGNLGTLIRTAHGLSWDGIVLTENTVDPFNDKALRAAKGSTFSLPLFFLSQDELKKLIKEKYTPFLADLNGLSPESFSFSAPLLLILSSESKGAAPWTKIIKNKITIPMKKDIDSLNVAVSGAILMYLMRKK